MSLVVVGVLALLCLAGMGWLTRQAMVDLQTVRAGLPQALERQVAAARADREALLAHLASEAQSSREERQRLLDRIEAPGATAAITWQQPEATKSLTEEDEEWLQSKDSVVPWDEDLALADVEVEG